jgi:hypothetical protein
MGTVNWTPVEHEIIRTCTFSDWRSGEPRSGTGNEAEFQIDIVELLAPGPLPGGDFGRNLGIFDRYLRTQAGVLARSHNPYSAVQQACPRQNDNQLCDARRFRL